MKNEIVNILKTTFFIFVLTLCLSLKNADACSSNIQITSPTNGGSFTYTATGVNGYINTSWSSDCWTKPVEVKYYMNGSVVCDYFNGYAGQLSCPVSGLGVGSYSFIVYAYMNGATAVATSNTVNISVVPPPTSLTLSVNTTSINMPANVVLTANPTVNGYGYVSKVEFYGDGNLLFTSSGSPYTYTWQNVAQGNHSITAKAYNGQSGAVATTSAINLSVYNPPSFIAFDNQCPAKL